MGESRRTDPGKRQADSPFPEGLVAHSSEDDAAPARVDGLQVRWGRCSGERSRVRPAWTLNDQPARASGACYGRCFGGGHFCQHRRSPFTRCRLGCVLAAVLARGIHNL